MASSLWQSHKTQPGQLRAQRVVPVRYTTSPAAVRVAGRWAGRHHDLDRFRAEHAGGAVSRAERCSARRRWRRWGSS